MFITAWLCAKPKSKFVLVLCESMVSGHKVNLIRERLAEKMEFMQFDPYAQVMAYYKERKKIRSIKDWRGENAYTKGYNDKEVGEPIRKMQ
ncbi:39S ribosomal protein L33, mitochondrial isoform X2 [Diachasma alloeum]|uniref:39S ribosomal protein L33, mitochondrial isoform X1 n=1 Tax=Diachasma alloeum TaxID=454923 RepID=UPI000738460E|nr:39S ribosomal protein L33, mitochondrial isoform X1 [Diachasma alloeum]XP_015127869.1 39S ribosomal protein L33, mitochondrial isoform X2 [Diachasma alloeum]